VKRFLILPLSLVALSVFPTAQSQTLEESDPTDREIADIRTSQAGKPLVAIKCPFRDESVLSCVSFVNFVQDSLDGISVVTEGQASIIVTLTDDFVGDYVDYTISVTAPSGNLMIRIQFPRTADDKIRREKLLRPIQDFLKHLVSAPLSSGENDGKWYVDFNGNARFGNNGRTNSSYGAGGSNRITGFFEQFKLDLFNNFDFNSATMLYAGQTQTISAPRGGTIAAGTLSISPDKRWNVYVLGVAEHNPAGKNCDFTGGGMAGLEWNLVPIRDQGQPTQVKIEIAGGYTYNDYRIRTVFDRLYEGFATGNASVVFVAYSKDQRIKTSGSLGCNVPLRENGGVQGTYSGGAGVSYQIRPSKPSIRLDAHMNLNYRKVSLTDPSPRAVLNPLFYSLYNNSPGVSTGGRVGFTIIFGNTRKRNIDQRGPNF
jgi:hypothetical protein